MLSTNQKGAIAESAIIHAAIKLGVGVYRPVFEGGRYDLILEVVSTLVRVQCKSAVLKGAVLAIPCYSARRTRDGFLKRPYTRDEVDAIVAYCAELNRCFFLPLDQFGCRTYIQLRLPPSRNNQKVGINWADDYEFEALHWSAPGAIAQLGERCDGIAEVAGSSPAGSTSAHSAVGW